MSLPPLDLSLAANLRRLSMIMRGWPGTPLTPEGTLRHVNEDAETHPPIYWCFNSEAELPALMQAMGRNQAIVGMRSLNQILQVTPETSFVLEELADHYAAGIVARFGRRPCIVGGNCQSASIAWRVAVRLKAVGVPILRLVTLDAELRFPFPGRVRLLFGEQSEKFNPFLQTPADADRPLPWHWVRAWRDVDWHIVPGNHGQYFLKENVAALSRAILAPHDAERQGPRGRLNSDGVTWRIAERTETGFWIEAEAGYSHRSDLALLPVWQTATGGLVAKRDADWIIPLPDDGNWRVHVASPAPGTTTRVTPVLCAAGFGPLV